MNISVDAIIISLTARCLPGLYPRQTFRQRSRFDFYKLLKNNMPTCDGKPKWPVSKLTAAWVCTGRWTTRPTCDQVRPWKCWWRMSGSNRRPPACKAGALPAELIPHVRRVVGLVGFEPTTPALSRRCSNQLSYRPTSISSRAA